MKKKQSIYYFFIIAIFTGYFLSVQLRSNITISQGIVTIPKILEMKNEIENVKKESLNLASSINEAKLKLKSYEDNIKKGEGVYRNMEEELISAKANSDYEKMEGPGIIISMNDSVKEVGEDEELEWLLIHDTDVLEIINELRAAGAEAISVNDERITATSNIRCGGPTINIDGKRHAVPFIIKAIGNPKILEASATAPIGYIDLMEYYGIRINIQKVERLTINAYDGKYKLNYQKK